MNIKEEKIYVIRVIITSITLLTIVYGIMALVFYQKHEYTYVKDDVFGKSNNCYIDKNDNRVCEVKKALIKVDMYYEESK